MYFWARQFPATDATEEAKLSVRVIIDMYQWFHEVCSTKLLQIPVVLGGFGVIDEFLFRHKPKVGKL